MGTPGTVLVLVLAVMLTAAGAIVGYEVGRGIGYLEGERAGKAAEAAALSRQAADLAQEALEARAPAERPGAMVRLLKNWCRDCGP